MNNFMVNWLLQIKFAGQVILVCLAIHPTLTYATTIDISDERLEVSLQALDESFYFTGSAFAENNRSVNSVINSSTVLPNSCCELAEASSFASMYWWRTSITDNGFSFFGDANTDRNIDNGDYDPDGIAYASSVVSLDLQFTVNGSGASLLPQQLSGSPSNVFITIRDLTAGTLFLGSDLLSGHDYYVTARSQSINGSGDEQIFSLNFNGAHARVPEPGTTTLLGIGLLGMGLFRRKKTPCATFKMRNIR